MLEKPDIPDADILTVLQDAYGIQADQIAFLPIGADLGTAVYRASTSGHIPYFVKLRSGGFSEISLTLPKWLSEQGISHLIPPLTVKTGRLWTHLGNFTLFVYPFVEGQDGYSKALTDEQWRELGDTLKRIHTANIPEELIRSIPGETYSSKWRTSLRESLAKLESGTFEDPLSLELAAFVNSKQALILDLVRRTDRLGRRLAASRPTVTVCHSDLHAGNILIDPKGHFYIVDWDNPILAPKERDLMFPGGAQGFLGHTAQEEERLFYQGYGQVEIDQVALAYYRYERIIEDLAIYCQEIGLAKESQADREQSLRYLKSNFLPNNTIATAYASDRTQGSTQYPPEEK